MESDPWLLIAGSAAALILGIMATLSAWETAVLNARRSRLSQLSLGSAAAAAEAIIEAPERFQASAHLAKSLCESLLYANAALIGLLSWLKFSAHALPAPMLARLASWSAPGAESPTRRSLAPLLLELLAHAWPALIAAAVLAFLLVTLFGETLPKALATRNPELLVVRASGPIRVFTFLFTPFLSITRQMAQILARSTGTDPALHTRAAHSEEEIKLLVEGSAEEGVLEEEEKEMIHSIFEFTDKVARQVMVPRIDIEGISVEATVDDLVNQVLESGYSRLPVYDTTLDTVVGVIHVKDLLPQLVRGERNLPIRRLMRDPYFVPEGKALDELLHEFRRQKSQLAIVVDEFGGTSGLVTVEDVLEEIVGEIEDEYDVDEHPAMEASISGEGSLVDARMSITGVNEELGLEVPEGDYETLGGFVFSLLGRAPEVGDRVRHENLEFVVEAMEGRRLVKIGLIVHEPVDESAEEPVG